MNQVKIMSENPFRWVIPFTIIDSINRIFYGMYATLIGPSNPYLARKLSVGIDDINLKEPFGKFLLKSICETMFYVKISTSNFDFT